MHVLDSYLPHGVISGGHPSIATRPLQLIKLLNKVLVLFVLSTPSSGVYTKQYDKTRLIVFQCFGCRRLARHLYPTL
jgi:hypothetical protein